MQDISSAIESIRQRLGSRLCIMGHHYESDDVVEHCDVTGDSLELARRIPSIDAEFIVFCGVSFMGESAALLAKPGQAVILPEPAADCQMARMAAAADARRVLEQMRTLGLDVLPLAYVNTDVPLKAVVGEFGGSVCTSANARTMMEWAFNAAERVLFIPDMHLGRNTARELGIPEEEWHILELAPAGIAHPQAQPLGRKLLLWPGYCPVHAAYTPAHIEAARSAWPGCRITVHPEASPEVVSLCDAAGSTSFLIKDAEASARRGAGAAIVVGTEINLVHRLAKRSPSAAIVPLVDGEAAACPDMAMVTQEKLLRALESIEAGTWTKVVLSEADREPARLSLTRMLKICG